MDADLGVCSQNDSGEYQRDPDEFVESLQTEVTHWLDELRRIKKPGERDGPKFGPLEKALNDVQAATRHSKQNIDIPEVVLEFDPNIQQIVDAARKENRKSNADGDSVCFNYNYSNHFSRECSHESDAESISDNEIIYKAEYEKLKRDYRIMGSDVAELHRLVFRLRLQLEREKEEIKLSPAEELQKQQELNSKKAVINAYAEKLNGLIQTDKNHSMTTSKSNEHSELIMTNALSDMNIASKNNDNSSTNIESVVIHRPISLRQRSVSTSSTSSWDLLFKVTAVFAFVTLFVIILFHVPMLFI